MLVYAVKVYKLMLQYLRLRIVTAQFNMDSTNLCNKIIDDYAGVSMGPRASSGRDIRTADSNVRLSVNQRTPGLSERMSDLDAMSIQMDAYDDVVEGKLRALLV